MLVLIIILLLVLVLVQFHYVLLCPIVYLFMRHKVKHQPRYAWLLRNDINDVNKSENPLSASVSNGMRGGIFLSAIIFKQLCPSVYNSNR